MDHRLEPHTIRVLRKSTMLCLHPTELMWRLARCGLRFGATVRYPHGFPGGLLSDIEFVGPNWPYDGEIDIIEAINMMTYNQMAIHTTPGCTHSGNVDQLGVTGSTTDCSLVTGCVVTETSPNSYSSNFSDAGGGVWATQFDVSGIL
jgi:hypothetical protein